MIVIKKYPNRRLYNTETSRYINLDGIQSLIRKGTVVQIQDSKTGLDVTVETLLLHALDSEIISALIPSDWLQDLMRMKSNHDRLQAITERRLLNQADANNQGEPESETQPEDRTQPRVETPLPLDVISESESSEISDSDSEVTMVREKAPPTDPAEEFPTVREVTGEIDVQVSMDAWNSPQANDDTSIPSFWSSEFSDESIEELLSIEEMQGHSPVDASEDVDVNSNSDDELFRQPETVVVRIDEELSESASSSSSVSVNLPDDIEDVSSANIDTDSSVFPSDPTQQEEGASVSPAEESMSDRDSVENLASDEDSVPQQTPTASTENSPEQTTEPPTKIAKTKNLDMKAKLEAMRAKLRR